MSKEIRKSFSEEEFRESFDSLPEASKEYLVKNGGEMGLETFNAYFTGFIHGREQVLEIVNAYIRRVEEILHK
jgi:hypothetical protein